MNIFKGDGALPGWKMEGVCLWPPAFQQSKNKLVVNRRLAYPANRTETSNIQVWHNAVVRSDGSVTTSAKTLSVLKRVSMPKKNQLVDQGQLHDFKVILIYLHR